MIDLKGTKVIELASVLAGPAVGLFFAELGAEVIKIENKSTNGDVTRNWKLPSEKAAGQSAYYSSVNWGKEVWMLDLKEESDRAKTYAAIKEADIVIANYRAASAVKLGIDYSSLKKINHSLIYGNITGYGEDSSRPAFDVVLQAESGFMYMNGQADGPPTKMPVALIDLLAAHQLKQGLLLALLHREKTGEGSYVSISLLEAAVASLANQATNWLMAGHIPQRIGSLHPNIAPYGECMRTKDAKDLVLAIGNDKQFEGLCEVLGVPDLAKDERYKINTERVRNRQDLTAALEEAFMKFEMQDLVDKAEAKNIPLGQIRNMKEVFEQAKAAAMILEEEVAGQLTKRVRTAAFKIK
jgi:crotonobetainyl-CoA:carnitine CoA-transferase CaiB-like acyl-CoA transferase